MLLEFSVTNFRSLRDRQTLSLVKGKGGELAWSNAFEVTAHNKFELLHSAAIYGPNASGKTNILLAMQAMKKIVLGSATRLQQGDELDVTPFLMGEKTRHEPSEFEMHFIVGKVRYQYGFAATRERIHEEWLLAYPRGRGQYWIDRTWNEKGRNYDWKLGGNLTGEKKLWQKSTRDNALFLSTAVQLNSQQLTPVYDWFKNTLNLEQAFEQSPRFSKFMCEMGEEHRIKIKDFLCAADLGIDDIVVEQEPLDPDKILDEAKTYRKALADKVKGRVPGKITMVYTSEQGHKVDFDLDDECAGVRKMFSLAAPWIQALANGHVLVIDGLHDNLHPRVLEFLVSLFHNAQTNPRNAQLIFTTHETSILNQEELRRDQIWFCKNDKSQATTLYPLTDFRPRKGFENLESAYISGRYGAVPCIGPFWG